MLGGFLASISRILRRWSVRIAVDPEFFCKQLMEEDVGLGLVSGMFAEIVREIISELYFTFSDIEVGAKMTLILVYLVVQSFRARGNGMGKLPASLFTGSSSLDS